MAPIEGIILIVTVLYLLYKYGTKNFNHWRDIKVPHKKPIPFIGSSANFFTKKHPPNEEIENIYNDYPDSRFIGIYQFMQPILFIRDLELVKQIMIKDFDYFTNRNSPDTEEVFGKNLLTLKDQKWRNMRNALSPVFTASKMKFMFKLVDNCAEQMTQHLDGLIKKQIKDKSPAGDVYETELKELFSRFANDVIATTAFGIEVDSLKDPENEFFKMGLKVTDFGGLQLLKFMVMLTIPKLAKILKLKFFSKEVSDFFRSLVHGAIKVREEKNIVRPDLIHILMQARKGVAMDENEQEANSQNELSDDDITSQAMLFFFAGFDTTSTVLSFCVNELAINPEIQDKLRDEIESVIEQDGGKMTYDGVINKMKYLEAVVNETLRKWPPGFLTDRKVSKTYEIPETEGSPKVTLNVDDVVMIPVCAIHRDPQYFPDPEKFDPERFTEENKANIVPFSFLGFGQGPRNCIGMRFALMETKLCLAHLVRKFLFVPTAKTSVPLKLDRKNQAQLRPENGFTVGIKPRS